MVVITFENDNIIYLNNSNTPKKLKDFYNNEKILGNTPIFCDNNNVLWVIGKRISSYFKVTNKTKKILMIEKL